MHQLERGKSEPNETSSLLDRAKSGVKNECEKLW